MFELLVEERSADEQGDPVVRCLAGHTSPGDLISSATSPDGLSLEINSEIESIERYPGIFTDLLDASHVARLTLRPTLPATVTTLWHLHGPGG